jgi:hypothetical protein
MFAHVGQHLSRCREHLGGVVWVKVERRFRRNLLRSLAPVVGGAGFFGQP